MKLLRATVPDAAYIAASADASFLWDMFDNCTTTAGRGAVYDELSKAYTYMARAASPGQTLAGYDGDLTADLRAVSSLCWVLATSEYTLTCDPASRPDVPFDYIPGAAGDARLAEAWQMLWDSSDRAQRAFLLRGRPGGPARRGEQRQPGGIIPLTGLYAGSAVTGFLEHVADTEAALTRRAAWAEAAR